jgi:hypothetical protein
MDSFIYFVGVLAIFLFIKFLYDTYIKGERYYPKDRRIDNHHTADYDDVKEVFHDFLKIESVKKDMKYEHIKRLIDKRITAQNLKKTVEFFKSIKFKEFEEFNYDDITDTLSHNKQIWTQEFFDNMGFMIVKSNQNQGFRDFVCYYNGPDDYVSEIGREKTLNWLNSSDSFMSFGLGFRLHYDKEYAQFGGDYIQSRVIGIYLIQKQHPNFISTDQLEYLTNIAFELEGKTHPYLLSSFADLCFEKNNFSKALEYFNLAILKTSKNEHYDLYSLHKKKLKTLRKLNIRAFSSEIVTTEEKMKYHDNLWSSKLDDNVENDDDDLPF